MEPVYKFPDNNAIDARLLLKVTGYSARRLQD